MTRACFAVNGFLLVCTLAFADAPVRPQTMRFDPNAPPLTVPRRGILLCGDFEITRYGRQPLLLVTPEGIDAAFAKAFNESLKGDPFVTFGCHATAYSPHGGGRIYALFGGPGAKDQLIRAYGIDGSGDAAFNKNAKAPSFQVFSLASLENGSILAVGAWRRGDGFTPGPPMVPLQVYRSDGVFDRNFNGGHFLPPEGLELYHAVDLGGGKLGIGGRRLNPLTRQQHIAGRLTNGLFEENWPGHGSALLDTDNPFSTDRFVPIGGKLFAVFGKLVYRMERNGNSADVWQAVTPERGPVYLADDGGRVLVAWKHGRGPRRYDFAGRLDEAFDKRVGEGSTDIVGIGSYGGRILLELSQPRYAGTELPAPFVLLREDGSIDADFMAKLASPKEGPGELAAGTTVIFRTPGHWQERVEMGTVQTPPQPCVEIEQKEQKIFALSSEIVPSDARKSGDIVSFPARPWKKTTEKGALRVTDARCYEIDGLVVPKTAVYLREAVIKSAAPSLVVGAKVLARSETLGKSESWYIGTVLEENRPCLQVEHGNVMLPEGALVDGPLVAPKVGDFVLQRRGSDFASANTLRRALDGGRWEIGRGGEDKAEVALEELRTAWPVSTTPEKMPKPGARLYQKFFCDVSCEDGDPYVSGKLERVVPVCYTLEVTREGFGPTFGVSQLHQVPSGK